MSRQEIHITNITSKTNKTNDNRCLSRQKITNETRAAVRPRRRIGQRFSQSVTRVEANNPDFDVLKQAREGVWYRKLEEGEGVNLIRVKGDEDILNRHPVTQEGIKIKRNWLTN